MLIFCHMLRRLTDSIPVVTLTLYYGNEAWGPKSLYEMMGIDEEWEETALVEKMSS